MCISKKGLSEFNAIFILMFILIFAYKFKNMLLTVDLKFKNGKLKF